MNPAPILTAQEIDDYLTNDPPAPSTGYYCNAYRIFPFKPKIKPNDSIGISKQASPCPSHRAQGKEVLSHSPEKADLAV